MELKSIFNNLLDILSHWLITLRTMKIIKNWILLLLLLFPYLVKGQDGHYWTQQYGTRSMLLSGSVIGGVEDLGAVFYNPGRLGQIENPAFLLSADVYQWTRVNVTDAFGESEDASRSDFGGVPSLVAGTFKIGFLKNHRFAYSVLQRQSIDLNFSYKNEVEGDVLENYPGSEFFGAEIRLRQKVKDQWASLTWSYPFTENFSAGLTTTVSIFNQEKGNIIELQALSSTNQTAIYRFNRGFSINQYALLWKAGLSYNLNKAIIGLTVTTPSVALKGDGNYRLERFFSGIEGITPDSVSDIYTTSRQNNLPVTIKKPWAVGAGITFPFGKRSRIHLSSEWYSNISQYTIMEAEPHVSQSTGDTINFALVDELNSVLNFGIGYELYIQEKISLYGSFSTDFSAVAQDPILLASNKPVASNSVFTTDYYHFGGGVVLALKGVNLTLGTTYTGGKQDFSRPVDFPDEEDDGIFDEDEIATLGWQRWRLVFSFSVRFLEDIEKKIK